jgi:hypothetical protein
MSFAANIIGLHAAVTELTTRVNAISSHSNGEKEVATDSIARFVEDKLKAQVDAKMEAELETRLDAKFEGLLDLKLAAALDAKIEQKLDTKVSVAVKRERAFLEQSIKDALTKTFVDIIDTRMRTLKLEMDAAYKVSVADLSAMIETVRADAIAAAAAAVPTPVAEPVQIVPPAPVEAPVEAPAPEPEALPEPVPEAEVAAEPVAEPEIGEVVVTKARRAKKASAKK